MAIKQLLLISCVGFNTFNLFEVEVTKPESKAKEVAKKPSDDKPVMPKKTPSPGTGRMITDHLTFNFFLTSKHSIFMSSSLIEQ